MFPDGKHPGVPQVAERRSEPVEESRRWVLCRYGIHAGCFPIGGMRVDEARLRLAPLLDIDPKAKAVIEGKIVDEDFVIAGDVDLLSFVKQASIMGDEYVRFNAGGDPPQRQSL